MLIVRDFPASLRFYRDVLRLQGDGESPYAEFASNSCKLVLLDHGFWSSMGGRAFPTVSGGTREGVVLAIQVEDVDEEHRRILAGGSAIETPPTDRPTMGLRNFQLRDPDGNLVEVTAPLRR
jgi:lactoylglutathione lyase